MAGNRRSSTLILLPDEAERLLGMAGNRRSSTLSLKAAYSAALLGMAGNRRSSTLPGSNGAGYHQLGMAGNRRSSTLQRLDDPSPAWAGDGRESPLKYTWPSGTLSKQESSDGFSRQKRRICSGASSGSLGFFP